MYGHIRPPKMHDDNRGVYIRSGYFGPWYDRRASKINLLFEFEESLWRRTKSSIWLDCEL